MSYNFMSLCLLVAYLCLGLSAGFRLGCHCPLQLGREAHVFHLHAFHFHSPRLRSIVQSHLHEFGNSRSIREHLREGLRSQDIAKGGLGEELGTVAGIFDLGYLKWGKVLRKANKITERVAFSIRKYITASTFTVTESLERIWKACVDRRRVEDRPPAAARRRRPAGDRSFGTRRYRG